MKTILDFANFFPQPIGFSDFWNSQDASLKQKQGFGEILGVATGTNFLKIETFSENFETVNFSKMKF